MRPSIKILFLGFSVEGMAQIVLMMTIYKKKTRPLISKEYIFFIL